MAERYPKPLRDLEDELESPGRGMRHPLGADAGLLEHYTGFSRHNFQTGRSTTRWP
jgi:hypothetical protein